MGIIGDIKKFFNNAKDKVTSLISPTLKVGTTLSNEIDNGAISDLGADTFPNTGTTQTNTGTTIQPISFNLNAQEENDDMSFRERVNDKVGQFGDKLLDDTADILVDFGNWISGIPEKYRNYVSNAKTQTDAQREYNDNENIVALGYNKQNGSIAKLKADDRLLGQIFEDASSKLSDNPTRTEYQQYMKDVYNTAASGDIFSVSPVYNGKYKKYTQDTLDKLAANNIKYGKYTPTEDEFWAYIETQQKNGELSDAVSKKYFTDEDGRTVLDLGDSELADVTSRWNNLSREGIQEKIQSKLGGLDASEATVYYEDATSDQINRILPFVESVYKYEKEALAKPANQRNEGDWYIIDTANIMRNALDKYAGNLNNWMTHILNEGVNSKGQIQDALDVFEGNLSLNDILTDGLKEIMGLETWGGNHASPIDMFEKLANDGIYKYKQANTSNLYRKGWNWLEETGEPVGDWFGEVGQWGATRFINVANLFSGKGRSAASTKYFDMDFSIGKLIETDDSARRRLIKKYALKFGEYIPEGIANIAPDVLMIMYNAPGGIARATTNIGRIGRFREAGWFNRAFKANQAIQNLREKSNLIDKTLKGTQKVGEWGKQWANINSKNRRFWNIMDRTLTQYAIGQGMDAKLSVYDTEPYSDTSFWISTLGSALFDIAPELKDLYGIWRTGIRGGKGLGGVWDLVDYIEKASDEDKLKLALAMGKTHTNFSEQELKDYLDSFREVTDAAEQVYNELSAQGKAAANSWTKDLMYNYVKQRYGANSTIGNAVRTIINNKNTNAADVLKYVSRIPGDVKFGPYTSTIRLKNGTLIGVSSKEGGWYDPKLDMLSGGFDRRVQGGFSLEDIYKLSSIDGYKDVFKNRDALFHKVYDKDRGNIYFLTEEGLDAFGLSPASLTLESLGVTVEQAENAKEILKEKMKGLSNKKISDTTIDKLADGGGYDEIVNKVKEVLC